MDKKILRKIIEKAVTLEMLEERLVATGLNQDKIDETMEHMEEQARTKPLKEMQREAENFRRAMDYAGLDKEATIAELVAATNTGDQSKVKAIITRVIQQMRDHGVIINDKSRQN